MRRSSTICRALLGTCLTMTAMSGKADAVPPTEPVTKTALAEGAEEPLRPFAGIWQGGLLRSGSGNTDHIAVFVNLKANTATVSNFFPGPQTGRITVDGSTITWKWMLATWKMTVGKDGQTATIDADSPFEACRGNLMRMFDH